MYFLPVQANGAAVGGKNAAQNIHQGRFADVGITHQRHTHHRTPVRSLDSHLTVDLLQILLEFADPVADDSTVRFDLALAGTAARSRAAPLPLQVRPHTRQTREHILVIGQLHLGLGIGRLRPRHENIENQTRAVENPAGHGRLDVARLRRREFVVENRHVDLLLLAIGSDLLQFPRTDINTGRRLRKALRKTTDTYDTGRFSQKFQFGEVLFRLTRILLIPDDRDQYGPFEPGPGSGSIVLRYNLFILILFQSAIRFLHDYAPSERHIFLHGENKGIPASRRIPLSNVSNKP